jgi:hypothetical protein
MLYVQYGTCTCCNTSPSLDAHSWCAIHPHLLQRDEQLRAGGGRGSKGEGEVEATRERERRDEDYVSARLSSINVNVNSYCESMGDQCDKVIKSRKRSKHVGHAQHT